MGVSQAGVSCVGLCVCAVLDQFCLYVHLMPVNKLRWCCCYCCRCSCWCCCCRGVFLECYVCREQHRKEYMQVKVREEAGGGYCWVWFAG